MKNEYDEIRGMLNKIRSLEKKGVKNLREQIEQPTSMDVPPTNDPNVSEPSFENNDSNSDVNVINNVDIEIHSDDNQDITLKDEEKGKISQLIDDFRTEVSEIADLEKMDIYDNSGKLSGKIGNIGLGFTLSGGDDEGLYLMNSSMLKIDDTTLEIINKLKTFQSKFNPIISELIINRKEN